MWELAGQNCIELGGRLAGHVCAVSRLSEVLGSGRKFQENCVVFRRISRLADKGMADRTAQISGTVE